MARYGWNLNAVDATGEKKKPAKYQNRKKDGYDSEKEFDRAQVLLLLQRAGKITNLETQRRFLLIPSQPEFKLRPVHYKADFVYQVAGEMVVEDTKSEITRKNPTYVIKKKLMAHVHGIAIKET